MSTYSKSKVNFWRIVFLFFVLSILIGSIVGLIYIFWELINEAPSHISSGIIAVSGTILVTSITLIITKSWERKLKIENENRLKKIPIYEEFMTFWFKNILSLSKGSKEKPLSQDQIVQSMGIFTEKIIIWGSDKVIKSYSDFRQFSFKADINNKNNAKDFIIFFEKLLFAIRTDLGHKNYGLKTGDIISLFMIDYYEHFK